MKRKIFSIALLFFCVLTVITAAFETWWMSTAKENGSSEYHVLLNEVEQLGLAAVDGDKEAKDKFITAVAAIKESGGGVWSTENVKKGHNIILGSGIVNGCFLLLVFLYLYFKLIRPFAVMENFAGEIAKGNFDVQLPYERTNYFGQFTWAFDHMRQEIVKARSCEKEAIENNKTVIATLSHDIKTPIASIRAYVEGLLANMDSGIERRQRYASVIIKKCDEVKKLTDDIFFHSLADLDKLKLNAVPVSFREVFFGTLDEINDGKDDIKVITDIPECVVEVDPKRFVQVFENVISNARKYAGSQIEIGIEHSEQALIINIRDYGNGILDSDMPFIFEKFYRGKNAGSKEGAGLGLYIVQYIMQQLNGKAELKNHADGLSVILTLLKIS